MLAPAPARVSASPNRAQPELGEQLVMVRSKDMVASRYEAGLSIADDRAARAGGNQ